jgi:hypothetical protein
MLGNWTETSAVINPAAVVSKVIEHIIGVDMGMVLFQ